ncbi:MAG: (deoxy)nucleoside triphosphate pyrophosphohydrolase [Bacteroidota bacterium]
MVDNTTGAMPLRVTCAIIERLDHILIACRKDQNHAVAKCEFPGGKTEPGETDELCIHREINEELSIEIEILEKLPVFIHFYPDKTIELVPFICRYIKGDVKLKDHWEAIWIKKEALKYFDLMEADRPIAEHYIRK